MSKREHHYVPQFHLRSFQSAPRRINLFNIRRQKFVRDVSIKTQARRRRFYGDDPALEDALGDLEGVVAPVLQTVAGDRQVPELGTTEHMYLVFFLAMQLQRTVAAADKAEEAADKMFKTAFRRDPRIEGHLGDFRIGSERPALHALAPVGEMAPLLADLSLYVIVAPPEARFVTSDNPAVKYNKYCEGVRGLGVLGATCRGLLISFPVAPEVLLLMYDAGVYKLGTRRSTFSNAEPEDVHALNGLQVYSAVDNLYFSDWTDRRRIRALIAAYSRHRTKNPVRVTEYVEKGDEATSSLLQVYEAMPNMSLDLTFLSVKRRARRVPVRDRVRSHRHERSDPSNAEREERGQNRTFIRRDLAN